MSSNLDKLKKVRSGVKQDINRRGEGEEINGKHSSRLNKRINDIAKVISDPDVWNVNISSRDRMDDVERRVEELEHRVRGLSYLVKRIVMNKGLKDEDLQAIEDRVDNDNHISGSSE